MKKVILVLLSMGFVFPCFGKEHPPKNAQAKCTINGYDCLKIVNVLDDPTELSKMDLEIIDTTNYGSFKKYILSINRAEITKSLDLTTGIESITVYPNPRDKYGDIIKDKHGESIKYEYTLEHPLMKEPSPLPACTINGHDCQKVVKALDNPDELKKMGISATVVKNPRSWNYTLSNGTSVRKTWSIRTGREHITINPNLKNDKGASIGYRPTQATTSAGPFPLLHCTSDGQDCWKVMDALDNPTELNKMGLEIVKSNRGKYRTYKGTHIYHKNASYTLSNGITFFLGEDVHSVNKISFPNGETFLFNTKKEITGYQFSQEQPPGQQISICKINGYDCGKVLRALDIPEELKAMGLRVVRSDYYTDGGSREITLSNGVTISQLSRMDGVSGTSITFPNGEQFDVW